jgi:hypothetical protein
MRTIQWNGWSEQGKSQEDIGLLWVNRYKRSSSYLPLN